MMEQETYFAWYRLRGVGLVCLCSLVFFLGAYLANERSMAVNGTVTGHTAPITRVQTEERQAALSFDTAQGSVRVILQILEQCRAKATFFVTGDWAEAHPEELAAIAAAGHELGSRGQTAGGRMEGRSSAELQEELADLNGRIRDLTGSTVRLFRAPHGEYDSGLLAAVGAAGCLPVRWSIDSEDWKDYGVESILRNVTESDELGPGAIIRMHSGARYTAQALEAVIEGLRERGLEPVTVSELLS